MRSHDHMNGLLLPSHRITPPEDLRRDLQWRYVTQSSRASVERLLGSRRFVRRTLGLLPVPGKHTGLYDLQSLIAHFRRDLSPEQRIAKSQIVDHYMEETLGSIYIVCSDVSQVDRFFLSREGGAKKIRYEHMPTMEATGTTLGGLSEASIYIAKNSPEAKKKHGHPGWRIVTKEDHGHGLLGLPGKSRLLESGDTVFMPALEEHTFQNGRYLALHGNEPGFHHNEAILWMD